MAMNALRTAVDEKCFGQAPVAPYWETLASFQLEHWREVWRSSPVPNLTVLAKRLENEFTVARLYRGVAEVNGRVVAVGRIGCDIYRNNHLSLYVEPAYRRLGLGRQLVMRLCNEARSSGISAVIVTTRSHMGPGSCFARQFGSIAHCTKAVYELSIPSNQRGTPTATTRIPPCYECKSLIGAYPSDDWISVLTLRNEISVRYGSAVVAQSEVEAYMNAQNRGMEQHGLERLAVTAKRDGRLVGLVEGLIDKEFPEVLAGLLLAVEKPDRTTGLGHALVGQFLALVTNARPLVKSVRVDTLISEVLLARRLECAGFRLHHYETTWELPLRNVANA